MQLSQAELNAVYQASMTDLKLHKFSYDVLSTLRNLVKQGKVALAAKNMFSVPDATFEQMKNQVVQAQATAERLDEMGWSVIAALRQCPRYEFKSYELTIARRLVKQGLLLATENPRFFVISLDGFIRLGSKVTRFGQ